MFRIYQKKIIYNKTFTNNGKGKQYTKQMKKVDKARDLLKKWYMKYVELTENESNIITINEKEYTHDDIVGKMRLYEKELKKCSRGIFENSNEKNLKVALVGHTGIGKSTTINNFMDCI